MSTEARVAPATAVLREDLTPVCPHCEVEIPVIGFRRLRGPFGVGRAHVFLCPQCRKVLGSSTLWYPFPSR